MTLTSSHTSLTVLLLITLFTISPPPCTVVNALGTVSTTAVVFGTRTVCGILAGETIQRIQCYQNNQIIQIQPNVSFESISGGNTFFCGLRSGGYSLLCWNTDDSSSYSSFQPKRIYYSKTVRLTDLTVGDDQVCARVVTTGSVKCWRGKKDGSMFPEPGMDLKFIGITSGSGFTCGILKSNRKVHCWGHDAIGAKIQKLFSNFSMSSLVAGVSHACGLTTSGDLICKGGDNNNNHGELDVPFSSAFEFSSWGLALGADFSCAIRQSNGLVICWGGETNRFEYDSKAIENVSFETIVPGLDFVCGLSTWNLTVICWGPGWSNKPGFRNDLGLGMIIPGPCMKSSCSICGTYPNSDRLCDGSGNICRQCQFELPLAVPLPPAFLPPCNESKPISPPPGRSLNRVSQALVIVGSVGVFIGICTVFYFLWANACGWFGKRSDYGVEPPSSAANLESTEDNDGCNVHLPRVRPGSYKELGSGSSTEKFSLAELAAATSNFSYENKIGSGSFGIVYKGTLPDGREVAIKRGEIDATKIRKFQEKESAFGSELALLSRLHHKHLVGLVGYCQEEHERLLVYEYMSNGALHDHLHSKENIYKSSSILNSWKMRIKIALDAARGIEYLHDYAVPPIIHRDIKSSNILLDSNWTARVSDFGLSLMGPEPDQDRMSSKAVGTVGYIDPEYYVMNVLTTKSDVYGLGVVLLELLTGKRAVFRNERGTSPIGVVEYAVPLITAGQVRMLLDQRVEPPINGEVEAVELVADTALRCVNLEGRERPNVADVVADLDKAYSLCGTREKRHATFSITIPSASEC